jgi:predicted dehydrogenase
MNDVRAALIGYGDAGRGIHARLMRAVGHTVTHVVVRSPERAASARSDWPGVIVLPDVAALVAEIGPGGPGQVDVVVVASPTALHADHVRVLLAARRPIVVDKPLATDTVEARALVLAAEAAGVPLTVFQNRRWDSEQLTLRDVLAHGALGEVHRFERRWERWRPVPKDRWKENDPVGGGLLLDLGAHLVDAAVQLFGSVETVYAELRSVTTATEDDVFLALQHRGGVTSHLQASGIAGAPGPRTRVLGSGGAYVVTEFEGEGAAFGVVVPDGAAGATGCEGWIVRGGEVAAVPRAAGGHEDFYRAVATWARRGGPPPVDPWDAVRTAEILDAARVSARTRTVVTLRQG